MPEPCTLRLEFMTSDPAGRFRVQLLDVATMQATEWSREVEVPVVDRAGDFDAEAFRQSFRAASARCRPPRFGVVLVAPSPPC